MVKFIYTISVFFLRICERRSREGKMCEDFRFFKAKGAYDKTSTRVGYLAIAFNPLRKFPSKI